MFAFGGIILLSSPLSFVSDKSRWWFPARIQFLFRSKKLIEYLLPPTSWAHNIILWDEGVRKHTHAHNIIAVNYALLSNTKRLVVAKLSTIINQWCSSLCSFFHSIFSKNKHTHTMCVFSCKPCPLEYMNAIEYTPPPIYTTS
jgi:hypothetical protein